MSNSSPNSVSASPPFYYPSANLISTSPSTTVLGGIGLGSTLQNMRDYGRARTLSGENSFTAANFGKYVESNPTTPSSNKAGTDLVALSELPISPFDLEPNFVQFVSGGGGGDNDERSVNTDKGNADVDGMFDFEDAEAEEDEDEEEETEDMPFAWAQQSTSDSYVFNKGGISRVTDFVGNVELSSGQISQSLIFQQCMAPPVLTSFDQDNKSGNYNQDQGGTINFAFQKLDQLKNFQRSFNEPLTI